MDMSIFSILIFLFILTYTLIGLELFAFRVKYNKKGELDLENGRYNDANFNTFHQSFLMVFTVLSGDNWSDKYYSYYRSVSPILSSFFFLTLIIVG